MSDPTEVDIELGGRAVYAANLYPPKRPGGSFDGAAGLPGPMHDGVPDDGKFRAAIASHLGVSKSSVQRGLAAHGDTTTTAARVNRASRPSREDAILQAPVNGELFSIGSGDEDKNNGGCIRSSAS